MTTKNAGAAGKLLRQLLEQLAWPLGGRLAQLLRRLERLPPAEAEALWTELRRLRPEQCRRLEDALSKATTKAPPAAAEAPPRWGMGTADASTHMVDGGRRQHARLALYSATPAPSQMEILEPLLGELTEELRPAFEASPASQQLAELRRKDRELRSRQQALTAELAELRRKSQAPDLLQADDLVERAGKLAARQSAVEIELRSIESSLQVIGPHLHRAKVALEQEASAAIRQATGRRWQQAQERRAALLVELGRVLSPLLDSLIETDLQMAALANREAHVGVLLQRLSVEATPALVTTAGASH